MSERNWQDKKCWDCKFAVVSGRLQGDELKECRRHPPARLPRQPGDVVLHSGYPDVSVMRACAEFRR